MLTYDDWVLLDFETTDLSGYIVEMAVIDREGKNIPSVQSRALLPCRHPLSGWRQAVGSVCVFLIKASILVVVLAGRLLAAAIPLA